MSPESIAFHEDKLLRCQRNRQRAQDRRTMLVELRPGSPAIAQHYDDETDLIVLLSVEILELQKCLERWTQTI